MEEPAEEEEPEEIPREPEAEDENDDEDDVDESNPSEAQHAYIIPHICVLADPVVDLFGVYACMFFFCVRRLPRSTGSDVCVRENLLDGCMFQNRSIRSGFEEVRKGMNS